MAGIGCSSRFPYFVNSHGAHFIHGRAVPLASGVSLARPDLHVFLFGGDGDGFSIGGNHLDHGARKNIRMTYVIMDNFVYGLDEKADLAHVADRIQIQDRPYRSGRPAGQPDQETARCRSDVYRAHARDADQSHDSDDRARDGS